MNAWTFNSVLNGAILLLSLNFYVKTHLRTRGKKQAVGVECENLHSSMTGKEADNNLDAVKDKDL